MSRKPAVMAPLPPDRQALAENNRGLVFHTVGAFVRRGWPMHGMMFDELVSAGLWALCRAAAQFDEGRGFRFSTYACRAIWIQCAKEVGRARRRSAHESELEEISDDWGQCEAEPETAIDWSRCELEPRDRAAMILWMEGKSWAEVATLLGVSRQRINQIKDKAAPAVYRMVKGSEDIPCPGRRH